MHNYIENYQVQTEEDFQEWKHYRELEEDEKRPRYNIVKYEQDFKDLVELLNDIDSNSTDTNYVHFLKCKYKIPNKSYRCNVMTIPHGQAGCLDVTLMGMSPYEILYTPNLFWRTKNGQRNKIDNNHLAQINVLEVDVDGIINNGFKPTPETVNKILNDIETGTLKIPMPNWVEYGRNARFIYILKEPIKLTSDKQLRQRMIRTANAIMRHYANTINEYNSVYTLTEKGKLEAEIQEPHKTNRVPGALNLKKGCATTVHLQKLCDIKYTFQEHLNNFCPSFEINEHQTEKKKRSNNKDIVISRHKNIAVINSPVAMLMARLQALEEHKAEIPEQNHESLAYIYLETVKALHEYSNDNCNNTQIMNETLNFLHTVPNFKYTDRQLKSKLESNLKKDIYKFKDETIEEKLGVNIFMGKSYTSKQRIAKVVKGDTRVQKTEQQYQTVRELYLKGIKKAEIVKRTGLSDTIVRTYITKIRKGQEHYSNKTNEELMKSIYSKSK